MSAVPFLDLAAQDAAVGAEVRAAIAEVLASRQFILGPHVERFERAMAGYCGVTHAIGVASGTDALILSLAAAGAGPGTAILTSPFSFFASASSILRTGAHVVFADVDPRTMNLAPAAVEDAIAHAGGTLRGLVPVHLFGRIAPMAELAALARRHDVWIVEDAAQAVGARQGGTRAGAFGVAGCLSFYPTKNLGALGDGGMVLTSDAALAARVRQERHQGQTAPYEHASLGLCSRLDALQAAALRAKLRHLDAWNDSRRRVAGWYAEGFRARRLTGNPVVTPDPDNEAHVFHQYVVRVPDRDRLRAALGTAGIGTQIYYPRPLHRQPALAALGYAEGAFPESERASREVLALPVYPELRREQVETVVEAIAGFYA